MTQLFGNVTTAMVTPFNEKGAVDFDEAIRLGEYLIAHGTDALLLCGTTGESPTLTHSEEFELFDVFVKQFSGRVPIIAGTGSNCTRTAIESTRKAEAIGVDAVLLVSPYYNRPSQEGIYQHFKTIAENTGLPIMLYNIPGRTGVNIAPETILRLSEISNIVADKEAAGNVAQMAEIRRITPPEFAVYSGDDGLTLDFMKHGACGVVSVASHIGGDDIQKMVRLAQQQCWEAAAQLNDSLADLFEVLFITSNPVPLKAALRHLGFRVGFPRLPLVDVTPAEFDRILPVVEQYKHYF